MGPRNRHGTPLPLARAGPGVPADRAAHKLMPPDWMQIQLRWLVARQSGAQPVMGLLGAGSSSQCNRPLKSPATRSLWDGSQARE